NLRSYVPALQVLGAVVIHGPSTGPTVVGRPGCIAALEQEIARTIILHDEDHVALEVFFLCSQFSHIDAARPFPRNYDFRRRFPSAFAQTLVANLWVRLDCSFEGPEVYQVAPAFAPVVAETINVDYVRRAGIRADHDLQPLTSSHTTARAIAFDPRT